MKKNIKDYLHYYVWHECIISKPSEFAAKEFGLVDGEPFILTGKLLHYFTQSFVSEQIKLSLRKITSLTPAELAALSHLNEAFKTQGKSSKLERDAARTHYYISQGVDVFGLIEAGIAIEKELQTA